MRGDAVPRANLNGTKKKKVRCPDMDKDRQQAIALMRYSAIAPLISGVPEEYPSMSTYFRDLSEKGILHPSGQLRKYAPGTMKSWLLNYRKGGFDALMPIKRSDSGRSRRIDDELAEQIRYLKHTYPRITAASAPDRCRNLLY